MIHVAEAGESRGRVVVHLCSSAANPVAIDAAVWLARAFQSEIESLYVENQQILELAKFPFAREISVTGKVRRSISSDDIEREFRFASATFHSQVEARARAADVPVHSRVVRDEPIRALGTVCAACGPWSAVALADPFTSPSCPPLGDLLDYVHDATGLLVVGPRASRTGGRVVIALEDAALLPAMLGAAERLAAVNDTEAVVCLVASDEMELMALDNATRLVLVDRPHIAISSAVLTYGAEAAAAEALRQLRPGLIVARFGGLLMRWEGNLAPLAASLECPMLLLR